MTKSDEGAVGALLTELVGAWNRGDAQGFGARYRADGTFTNVNGALYFGREEFDRRHVEIFQGYLRGTKVEMTARKVRFARPDVALVDVETRLIGLQNPPPGAAVDADGAVRTSLLLVLVKEAGSWGIIAYHNVWRSASG
jgi:uncharacterized protein (TIGR02246 family)